MQATYVGAHFGGRSNGVFTSCPSLIAVGIGSRIIAESSCLADTSPGYKDLAWWPNDALAFARNLELALAKFGSPELILFSNMELTMLAFWILYFVLNSVLSNFISLLIVDKLIE